MSRIGMYDHLNKGLVTFDIPMPELVRMLENGDYGTHRLLSELVRQRRANPKRQRAVHILLTETIADAIEEGSF